ANDIRQVSAAGGDAATQRAAFDAARRAILRCQKGGFPLPVEKYEHWRDIEMTFNPEGMQVR
ncbi:MAG: energy transducer TonB, partial [Boseongicola sp.]